MVICSTTWTWGLKLAFGLPIISVMERHRGCCWWCCCCCCSFCCNHRQSQAAHLEEVTTESPSGTLRLLDGWPNETARDPLPLHPPDKFIPMAPPPPPFISIVGAPLVCKLHLTKRRRESKGKLLDLLTDWRFNCGNSDQLDGEMVYGLLTAVKYLIISSALKLSNFLSPIPQSPCIHP